MKPSLTPSIEACSTGAAAAQRKEGRDKQPTGRRTGMPGTSRVGWLRASGALAVCILASRELSGKSGRRH